MPIFNGFLPEKGHLELSEAFFVAEIFEKEGFDPYNFRITRLSARKSEQMKNFQGIKMCLYLHNYTFNNAMFKWFWTIFSLGAPDLSLRSCKGLLPFLAILSERCNYFLQAHSYFIHEVENRKKQKQTFFDG